MQGNLLKYINTIVPGLPVGIISTDTRRKLKNLAALFSDFAASEYIMESCLNSAEAEIDFSFRVLAEEKACLINGFKSDSFSFLTADAAWLRIVDFINYWPQDIEDVWLEMDYGEYAKQFPQPCFFFNAESIVKNREVDYALLFTALRVLIEPARVDLLKDNLKKVIQQLPPDAGLFQVGTMLARNTDRVRIFTNELSREQIFDYLAAIGWQGAFTRLEEVFHLLHGYSDGQYLLDFDVTEEGISSKIGINFGLKNEPALPAFLDNLAACQLCTDSKKKGVLTWSGSQGIFLGSDYGFTALIKDISHFKASYSPDEDLKVKAYLRFSGIYLKKIFADQKHEQAQTAEKEVKTVPTGYKEIQNVFKQIAKKSMLEKDYRELCLKDSKAAIQTVIGNDARIPDNIIFMEEEPETRASDQYVYILPPFLKPSWLTSK